MKNVVRFFAITWALWLLRRHGVSVPVDAVPATPAREGKPVPPPASANQRREDIERIVDLMVAEPTIGLVVEAVGATTTPRAVRFDGPGGRA